MNSIIELFHNILDPEKLIQTGGIILILLVVLMENGVFFAFFLPGDTLLFTAGLLCATNKLKVDIYTLILLIALSAIIGSLIGYFFGKKMGDSLFRKKDTLLFKKKYIATAEAFFNKYGGLALIMGRFLPIIRTFAPIFAGIVHFNFKKFLTFNITGGVLWVMSLLLMGYFFGILFPQSSQYLEYIIVGIVIITWIPVIRTYLKERKNLLKNADMK